MALITHLFNAGKGEQRERERERDRESVEGERGVRARNGRSVNTADEWEGPEKRKKKRGKKERKKREMKKEGGEKRLDTNGHKI